MKILPAADARESWIEGFCKYVVLPVNSSLSAGWQAEFYCDARWEIILRLCLDGNAHVVKNPFSLKAAETVSILYIHRKNLRARAFAILYLSINPVDFTFFSVHRLSLNKRKKRQTSLNRMRDICSFFESIFHSKFIRRISYAKEETPRSPVFT